MKATGNYQLLMDDDDKGEIADIVGFRVDEAVKTLHLDIYHCKFSKENPVPESKTFMKSATGTENIKWVESIDEIFKHLFRRSQQRFKRTGVNRLNSEMKTILTC